MLNRVIVAGRMTADPEIRHTTSGVAVTTFRIAVDRDYKDKETGDRKADFFTVVAWEGAAEFVSRYFRKGSLMQVDGKLRDREYTDKDGNRRHATEIVADRLYFGESKKQDAPAGGPYYAEALPMAVDDYGLPFN